MRKARHGQPKGATQGLTACSLHLPSDKASGQGVSRGVGPHLAPSAALSQLALLQRRLGMFLGRVCSRDCSLDGWRYARHHPPSNTGLAACPRGWDNTLAALAAHFVGLGGASQEVLRTPGVKGLVAWRQPSSSGVPLSCGEVWPCFVH